MKQYCGDGVFVQHDGADVVLTTEDGIRETNRIVLEPEVLAALLAFIMRDARENRYGIQERIRMLIGDQA